MSLTVPAGPFFSFTKSQLTATIVPLYQAELQKALKRGLTGASVNGQSLSFGERDYSLGEFQAELQAALSFFDEGKYIPPGLNYSTAIPHRYAR